MALSFSLEEVVAAECVGPSRYVAKVNFFVLIGFSISRLLVVNRLLNKTRRKKY